MRTLSARVSVVALVSGLVACAVGCGGDDSATPASNAGPAATGTGPAPGPSSQVDPPADAAAPTSPSDGGSPPAPEAAGRVLAYAFSSSPAVDELTPTPAYAYNAGGGAMKIVRGGTGSYTVTFAGLAANGTVALVSAYDTQGGLCSWLGTTGDAVAVRCYNAVGNAADTKFALTVIGKGTTGANILGFAHAHDKSAASYTPQATRSNNAVGGGAMTASRSAVGVYKMEFAGLGLLDIGSVQVTPFGDPNAHCVVKSWAGAAVNVHCFDNTGAPADAQYTVLLAGQKAGGTARVVAYAKAGEPTTASYSPALAYNDKGGVVTALRNAAGTYTMTLAGQDLNVGANVHVSAHDQGRRCNVQAWAGTTVNLTCNDSAGNGKDNPYALVVVQ